MARVLRNAVYEATLVSDRPYADPFGAVTLDVEVRGGDGGRWLVPAYWAGEQLWRFRFSSPVPSEFTWTSVCSDAANSGLHGRTGELEVTAAEWTNPLLNHGPLRVAPGRRYLEHHDGTPFFWLGDTWWMGFCDRLGWPHEWRTLLHDRLAKGFTLVQIIAGLYPDMGGFDDRGRNEGGFPWTADYGSINPAWFDHADLKIFDLVHHGLTPCVVGAWAYYLPWMGVAKLTAHWRYLIARWGALPVVWCLAGEGAMPWYLTTTREADIAQQRAGWSEVGRAVQALDPFDRPVTIHPTQIGRDQLDDPTVLDFDMLQTGHGDRGSLGPTIQLTADSYGRQPVLPVIESEVCYEGIGESCRQEVQRMMFWASFLAGARGFTYGANGIWQLNRSDRPYGASPHGMSWGLTNWDEAMHLPGSAQLGVARRFLERFDWWRFEPLPAGLSPRAAEGQWDLPLCAGIGDSVRLAYLPSAFTWAPPVVFHGLPAGARWRGTLVSPVGGATFDLGVHAVAANGDWTYPPRRMPIYQDWLVLAETE